jgi:hypothetical protein
MSIYSAAYVGELKNVANGQQAVGTIPTQMPDIPCKLAFLKNDDKSGQDVFIGDSSVTTATGFRLTPGEGIAFGCSDTNAFYAVAANAGATIDIIVMW